MRIPGFFAEAALEDHFGVEHHPARRNDRAHERPVGGGIEPAARSRAFCRRLLKKCTSGTDPHSVWCNAWVEQC